MNRHIDAERILAAYLAPEADQLPDRVIDAALADIARTPQRRALRVPWRFPIMPALTRATGIAAVALVAVVGAGGLIYLNARAPSDQGANTTPPTATEAATLTPTAAPTPEPTAEPSFVAPGITGWKTYTSTVYGYTISYPDDWSVVVRATERWQPGATEDDLWSDVFLNPAAVDGDEIVFAAAQLPGPPGADLGTWDGLLAALAEMCAKPTDLVPSDAGICESDDLVHMCLGGAGCQPVALVPGTHAQFALFGDPEKDTFMYLLVGRRDDFPAAERYGGTVRLLKSILGELGVREPRPGEIPT